MKKGDKENAIFSNCSLDFHPRNSSLNSHAETPSTISSTSEIDEMMNNVEIADRMNVSFCRFLGSIFSRTLLV